MIETLIFLIGQALINFLIKWIERPRITYLFSAFSITAFVVLLMFYARWSWRIEDVINPPLHTDFRCGNVYIGPFLFQWVIGIPLVILVQLFFNRRVHKLKMLIERYEGSNR